MADLDYYGADYGAEEPSRLGEALRNFGWVNWAGAATSLGLTAVVAVWAVDLTFRDMSNVPVIAALEGPMRVEPADPGGMQAPFQGLAMSDITSGGSAAPAPEEVVLAPAPVDLSSSAFDVAALAERRAAVGALPAAQAPEQAAAPAAQPELPRDASGQIDVAALAEQLAAEAAPLEEVVGASARADLGRAEVSAAPAAPQAAEAAPAALVAPGLARSARPSQRPAGLRRAPAVAVAPAATVPTDAPAEAPGQQVAALGGSTLDVDPASIAPGTRVVQLGAYDSEAAARSEWDRLYGRFRDFMDGKQRLVQQARSGGRDFWRLRVVGFEDGADARRFCSALLARDAACIPVTIR